MQKSSNDDVSYMNPKVTLAISVYNVAPYIERCVRSLFEQTFDEIEFLFVDDGSLDESMEIMWCVLEDYPSRKAQVRTFVHEHNMGTAVTKRDCYLQAKGDFVLVIDSDDFVELEMVEKMYRKAQETDADIVFCNVFQYSRERVRVVTCVPNGVVGCGDNVKDDVINHYVTPSLSCRMLKRTLFTDNEILWPVADYSEDYVISAETAYYAHRIAFVDEPFYHYCFNHGSLSRTDSEANKLKIYYDFIENLEIVLRFLEDKGTLEKYESGMFLNKVHAKYYVMPLLPRFKYLRLWVKTYPEVNRSFLFGDKYRKPTYRERFWVASMSLGMYPRFKRVIYSKRLRPRPEWVPVW